nr:Protein F55A4.2 [Haemonchus contortus]
MRPKVNVPILREDTGGHFVTDIQKAEALATFFKSVYNTQTVRNTSAQCFVWSDHTLFEICALSPEDRIQQLQATFLFTDNQPISLHSIFSAGSSTYSWSRRLLAGVHGADCVREKDFLCRACFDRLVAALRRFEDAYKSFDQTLFRFDCMPAVDTASATRPFSPNGSCTTCRLTMYYYGYIRFLSA